MTVSPAPQPFWIACARTSIQVRRPRLPPRWHAAVLLTVALSGPLWGLWGWLASRAGPAAPAMLVLGTVVGSAGLLSGRAILRWEQIKLLDGFSLLLDTTGVRWTGGRASRIPWTNIACLTIVGPPRQRRLWIARRGRWRPNPGRWLLTSSIMRSLRLEDLELDLPLRHLTVSEADLVEAIRAASGGVVPTAGRID